MNRQKALVDSLYELAKAILPIAIPGSGPALVAAEKAVKAIDAARNTIGATSEDLDNIREELASRVNAHVNRTVDTLRGDA